MPKTLHWDWGIRLAPYAAAKGLCSPFPFPLLFHPSSWSLSLLPFTLDAHSPSYFARFYSCQLAHSAILLFQSLTSVSMLPASPPSYTSKLLFSTQLHFVHKLGLLNTLWTVMAQSIVLLPSNCKIFNSMLWIQCSGFHFNWSSALPIQGKTRGSLWWFTYFPFSPPGTLLSHWVSYMFLHTVYLLWLLRWTVVGINKRKIYVGNPWDNGGVEAGVGVGGEANLLPKCTKLRFDLVCFSSSACPGFHITPIWSLNDHWWCKSCACAQQLQNLQHQTPLFSTDKWWK